MPVLKYFFKKDVMIIMNTNNNSTLYPEWEELKKNNPWAILFKNRSIEDIRHQICDWNTEFVHPDDMEVISAHNTDMKINDSNRFVLFKLPKPYRGNLKDPKLVILSLNPGFNERVNKTLFNMLTPEYQNQFIALSKKNLLLEEGCKIISNEVDDVLDNGYWTSKLSDLEIDDESNLSKIALIQFIPYASKNFGSWKEESCLKTQQFTKKIIHHLLHETTAIFLVMRSRDQWEKLIGDEMNEFKDRFMYNRNPRCQKLSRKNLWDENAVIKDQYQRIINAFKDS